MSRNVAGQVSARLVSTKPNADLPSIPPVLLEQINLPLPEAAPAPKSPAPKPQAAERIASLKAGNEEKPEVPSAISRGEDASTSDTLVEVFVEASPADAVAAGPVLVGIRLKPYSDTLRVVLLLTEPTGYVVHREANSDVASVELIGARAQSFSTRLNQINDPRLQGIWLQRIDGAGATLQFRLPGKDVQITDFALREPAVVVLDFFSPAKDTAYLPPPAAQRRKPNGNSRLTVFPAEAGAPPSPKPVEASHPPVAGESSAHSPKEVSVAPEPSQYDLFPVDEIHFKTREAGAILKAFLDGHWATALKDGLALIEAEPYTEDLPGLLFLLSEARFQLGQANPGDSPEDEINFFQQAIRRQEKGRLAGFANWRLAQLSTKAGRSTEAIPYLRSAMKSSEGELRSRIWFNLVGTLTQAGRLEEALNLIGDARREEMSADERIELLALEAGIQEIKKDNAGAWALLQRANALDPTWWRKKVEWADLHARIAAKVGKPEIAREAYFYAVYTFGRHTTERPGMYLDYADLLRRLAEDARRNGRREEATDLDEEAREWYRHILTIVDPREGDSEIEVAAKRRLQENYATDLARGTAGYALFYLNRGEVVESMAYLRKAYQKAIMGSADDESLRDAIAEILPAYMGDAYRQGQFYEVIGSWQMFGTQVEPGSGRNTCLSHLAGALNAIRLDDQLLPLLDRLLAEEEGSGIPAKDLLVVWKAEALNRKGEGARVLAELERIARIQTVTNVRASALKALSDVYEGQGRGLEAAQAIEEYARIGDLTPDERGEGWLRAGELYAAAGLAPQATEIGLEALRFEEARRASPNATRWKPAVGNRLRLMLARAYYQERDFGRAAVTLDDLLAREELLPDEKGFGGYLLGECRRQLGESDAARIALEAAKADKALPELWRKAAGQALSQMVWNEARAAKEPKAKSAKN